MMSPSSPEPRELTPRRPSRRSPFSPERRVATRLF
uniref:Aspartic proteinase oryzasin-1 n=1 Tax=Arundo donax TaxID=35708 RepID=A0A0A9G7L9_ARUDO